VSEYTSQRERFENRVDRRGPDECWAWLGYKSEKGYGLFGKSKIRAHRLAFFLAHGRWPEPMCLHRCDNPACCNPSHLFEGEASDNSMDMVLKNRQARGDRHNSVTRPETVPRGSNNGQAKLNESDIPVIRSLVRSGWSIREVASERGISRSQVQRIAAGEHWAHVP
jgi:hypothetical protein